MLLFFVLSTDMVADGTLWFYSIIYALCFSHLKGVNANTTKLLSLLKFNDQ